jgi:aldehyde dehydrogenase family 7 protein A1
MTLTFSKFPFLKSLGLSERNYGCYDGKQWFGSGDIIRTFNPNTGEPLAEIVTGGKDDYDRCIQAMASVRIMWAATPGPKRGEIVRQIGEALRSKAEDLGLLVSLEMGKVRSEGLGEVQEFIDICDLACGMSRQIPGQVIPSERPGHMLLETWNPLGLVGIISAFNFPVAVYGWNLAISMIAGNCNIWKGAPSTSLCSIACMKIVGDVLERNGFAGAAVAVCGGADIGDRMVNDHRLSLISFTGSTNVGRKVAQAAASRFCRTILELGGNNASIIMNDADLEMAIKGSAFGAVGTAGQRCTSLRRLLVHESVYDTVKTKLVKAYEEIIAHHVGNSLDEKGVLLGPLHSEHAYETYFKKGLEVAVQQGGKILVGGRRIERSGVFVEPTIVELPGNGHYPNSILFQELFVPIMYIIKIKSFEEAVELNNCVPQGLSSSLYSRDMRNVFRWIGPNGSDCGIVNVNAGTSGAEIGGAFGGDKETGGGRESGSDSWKQYMRRSTCTVNYSDSMPLAQGVKFDF